MKLSQEHFEELVYKEHFLKTVSFKQQAGFTSIRMDACTKEQLLEKENNGTDYVREEISAMWFGYKLAMKAQDETL